MELLENELCQIKSTGEIRSKLIHNDNVDDLSKFKLDTSYVDKIKQLYGSIDPSVKVILVDGFMLYNDKRISDLFDLKLLIRSPYSVLKQRRAARSGYQTLDSFWKDPPYYFDEFVYKSYVETHGFLFKDHNVEGELNPAIAKEIRDFNNGDGVAIKDAISWVCHNIIDLCKNI
ncbi:hypothetical protein Kpol_1048p11 [Vanderwaltozyma polyspora DSM 70294]|uniref:Nicotinamide riboside kinase n=1 Tax=Vanderwaltozyma polyspora (strain ATCC 22028 / DSM 70294 / BCRC 21397 / CBS 2163 / NBRC 10782 / NRRL Y-8283 / UCD 57-17) TaxID=436907 RepID=A7TGH4_VANPO|nr:uncharacterized protein Kpol_1048p11 [Vanderwaltozyma polyspora DSM 70294]EDO18581.1 hypothetical protein Kpol_1048p11 [Vanderwaltozyma polyspora DSM 70294]